ncbi:MAG: hypothetical protein J6M24_02615 [Lachnospiraceae bacterium]|nr:hypothetical protein [Lachnospiraceae bacterium]
MKNGKKTFIVTIIVLVLMVTTAFAVSYSGSTQKYQRSYSETLSGSCGSLVSNGNSSNASAYVYSSGIYSAYAKIIEFNMNTGVTMQCANTGRTLTSTIHTTSEPDCTITRAWTNRYYYYKSTGGLDIVGQGVNVNSFSFIVYQQ